MSAEELLRAEVAGKALQYATGTVTYVDTDGNHQVLAAVAPAPLQIIDPDEETDQGAIARYAPEGAPYEVEYEIKGDRTKRRVRILAPLPDPDPELFVDLERVYLAVHGPLIVPPGMTILINGQPFVDGMWTAGDLTVVDAEFNPVMRLERIWARTAQGHVCAGRYRLVTDELTGNLQIYETVPVWWMQSLEAADYPVVVDPTVVATNASSATAPSSQTKIVRFPSNGVLLAVYYDNSSLACRYSDDGGATWQVPSAGATIVPSFGQFINGSVTLDPSENIHIAAYNSGTNQWVHYVRGVPNVARTSYTWSTQQDIYSGGQYPDIEVHSEGTGWKAWIALSVVNVSINQCLVYRVNITAGGVISTDGGQMNSGSYGMGVHVYPKICIDPNKVVGVLWTSGGVGVGLGMRYQQATYSSGSWTWAAEEAVDESNHAAGGILSQAIDSQNRRVAVYKKSTDNTIKVVRRASGGGWTDLTGIPSITPTSVGVVCNGDDIYVVFTYASGVGYVKYTAASATWGSVINLVADATARDVSVRRTTNSLYIDVLYSTGSIAPYSVNHARITLNNAPTAPTNLSVKSSSAPTATDAFVASEISTWTATPTDSDPSDTFTQYETDFRDALGAQIAGISGVFTASGNMGTPFSFNVAAATFTADTSGTWRIRFKDAGGLWGAWSSYAPWKARSRPTTAITNPAAGTINTSSATVVGTYAQTGGAVVGAHQVQLLPAGGTPGTTTPITDTGWVTSSASPFSRTLTGLVNSTTYRLAARTRTYDGVESPWVTVDVTTSFLTPLQVKNLTAAGDAAIAAIKVKWQRGKQVSATFTRASAIPDTQLMDFTGKVAGSTTANPHVAKQRAANTFDNPTAFTSELPTYAAVLSQDGSFYGAGSSVNGQYGQMLFSLDLLTALKRAGKIPSTWTVTDLKNNVTAIAVMWVGYGVGSNGGVSTNGAVVKGWNSNTSAWVNCGSNGASSPASVTFTNATISGNITHSIDANGFVHVLAHSTYPSDGTIASTIYTDYVMLNVTFNYYLANVPRYAPGRCQNLLTANQSTWETDLTGASASSANISRNTGLGYAGTASLQVSPTSANTNQWAFLSGIPVQPGKPYSVQSQVRFSAAGQYALAISWRDSAGAQIGAEDSTGMTSILPGAWVLAKLENKTAPSTAVTAHVRLYVNLPSTADYGLFDAMQFEQNTVCLSWMLGGSGLGITVEEGSANILSAGAENFQTGWQTYQGSTVTVTGNQSDPFGGTAAYRVQTTGGANALKYFYTVGTSANGTPYSTQLWIKVNTAVNVTVQQNLGGNVVATQADGWKQVKIENRVGNGVSQVQILINAPTAGDSLDFTVMRPQIEAKAYCASYIPPGTTRAAETTTFPSANILNAEQGTIALHVNIPATNNSISWYPIDCYGGSNNQRLVLWGTMSQLQLLVGNGTTNVQTNTVSVQAGWNDLIFSWGPSGLSLMANGGVPQTSLGVTRGPTTLGSSLYMGSAYTGLLQGTGLVYDALCIWNVELTSAQKAAWRALTSEPDWSNVPAPENCTLIAKFNGDLEAGNQNSIHNGQYRIDRRLQGATDYTSLATVNEAADTATGSQMETYTDYIAGSGANYEYRVVALGSNGTETASSPVSASITRSLWSFVPKDDPANPILFGYDRQANLDPGVAFTEVDTRGPGTYHFIGGRKRKEIDIQATFVDGADATPQSNINLTKQQWRQRFEDLMFKQGYLCTTDGDVWRGILEPPKVQYVRNMVNNPLVVNVHFKEKGGVP